MTRPQYILARQNDLERYPSIVVDAVSTAVEEDAHYRLNKPLEEELQWLLLVEMRQWITDQLKTT